MANREAYTTAQMIETLRETRGMKGPAARRLGCSWTTVDNYVKRHPTVAAVLEEERAKFLDTTELALQKKIQEGDTTAIIFALKTIGRHRGYVERFEVMVEQEMEQMVTAMEESLPPETFREVMGVLAVSGKTG